MVLTPSWDSGAAQGAAPGLRKVQRKGKKKLKKGIFTCGDAAPAERFGPVATVTLLVQPRSLIMKLEKSEAAN